jgi:transposase
MADEYLYSKKDVCEMLGISYFTIENWYRWERKEISNGNVQEAYLPRPKKLDNVKGRPLRWSGKMIEELRDYQKKLVRGRNGRYGKYTNAVWH